MNNKYKLLKNICSNKKIDNLYDLLDSGLLVFSVKLNEDKHNVYRLFNTGLNVNDVHLSKLHKKTLSFLKGLVVAGTGLEPVTFGL